MTQAEYAAHRGCSVRTVRRGIEKGLIPVSRSGRSGRILVDKADALWAPGDTREPDTPAPPVSGSRQRNRTPSADPEAQKRLESLDLALLEARVAEKEAKAELAQMSRDAGRRDLIPRDDVVADGHRVGAAIRSALLGLGARLGGNLECACRDQGEVQRIVDAEVRIVLAGLQKSRWTHGDDPAQQ